MIFTNFSFSRAASASNADVLEDDSNDEHATHSTRAMCDTHSTRAMCDTLGNRIRTAELIRYRIVEGIGDHDDNVREHDVACANALNKLDELAEQIVLDLKSFAR